MSACVIALVPAADYDHVSPISPYVDSYSRVYSYLNHVTDGCTLAQTLTKAFDMGDAFTKSRMKLAKWEDFDDDEDDDPAVDEWMNCHERVYDDEYT